MDAEKYKKNRELNVKLMREIKIVLDSLPLRLTNELSDALGKIMSKARINDDEIVYSIDDILADETLGDIGTMFDKAEEMSLINKSILTALWDMKRDWKALLEDYGPTVRSLIIFNHKFSEVVSGYYINLFFTTLYHMENDPMLKAFIVME